ncbi:M20/M25/M40 family metallo-hydrolase [Massilia sp. TS11]|uniref:M20/M25/M40 family metallo-hydrolase n=1 Tax=Massilia sp. TS11 TaxID=2908003 RepID=UPI001EDB12BE|nr:M20/M25/M40 family metallo-hydrolase [Massilia sp. TS11]MCG2584888.1 M20/M25/M40 family metallo-hydrolase [Massilia sp. TS11]
MKSAVILATLLAGAPALAASPKPLSEAALLGHIQVLASDAFEGRAPGSAGEKKTLAYLERQLRQAGLKPGNPDGTYVQKVPMLGVTSRPSLSLSVGGKTISLNSPDDFVAYSVQAKPLVEVKASDLVFVGYGVQAPEYGWDDYKGLDVKGKTLVMLVNDPQVPDSANPAQLDPRLFKGKAMTWYGRWDYKYYIADKLGAAAAIIVHETGPAGYPWDVVRNSWTRENFHLKSADGIDHGFPAVSSWMQEARVRELFTAVGQDFDALKRAALSRDFRPVALGAQASFSLKNTWRTIDSYNVLGRIEGSDPTLKQDTLIYSAHWDHIGINEALPGPRSQKIFHGALDNASGVAGVLELARAYQGLAQKPKRSVLFLLTTGEEQGLLGARYYAEHPLYPLERTVADINFDGLNAWGKTSDIENVAMGHTSIDALVEAKAKAQGRTVAPDSRAEVGTFYRSDQLEFAKVGVPPLYMKRGAQFIGKPAGFGKEQIDAYTKHDYHQVSDNVRKDWDFSGAVQDLQLMLDVGLELANGAPRPVWRSDSEFARK